MTLSTHVDDDTLTPTDCAIVTLTQFYIDLDPVRRSTTQSTSGAAVCLTAVRMRRRKFCTQHYYNHVIFYNFNKFPQIPNVVDRGVLQAM